LFLLDTHTLIWFLDNDSRLPIGTKEQIESAEAVFVSIVSLWEIAIKINIGKLTLKTNFQAIAAERRASFEQNLIEQDISILPIDIAAIQTYLNLPLHHRDPFDRILIAQSIDLALTIISCDIQFDAYPVTRLWDI
jgi:PIN domain nuclease of toxin-antitoxin system